MTLRFDSCHGRGAVLLTLPMPKGEGILDSASPLKLAGLLPLPRDGALPQAFRYFFANKC